MRQGEYEEFLVEVVAGVYLVVVAAAAAKAVGVGEVVGLKVNDD